MDGAQIAVADYCPDWWPSATRLLIRRVALAPAQVSADPRSRRRRTLHPDQRALPIAELAEADTVYGYSFIVTNLDVSTPAKAAAVEHWYRHRTAIENVFRDAKHGAALRHLPSGYPQVNTAWMWGALLAVSIAGWLHQLTAIPGPDGTLAGHGVRDGQAMIATLRHRLIQVPTRLIRHPGALDLRLPPGYHLLDEILARLRTLPTTS
ncbi:MAG: transposase [Actinobacteria bacterium]|nr:transposase [Actinomycetota bacterium]